MIDVSKSGTYKNSILELSGSPVLDMISRFFVIKSCNFWNKLEAKNEVLLRKSCDDLFSDCK